MRLNHEQLSRHTLNVDRLRVNTECVGSVLMLYHASVDFVVVLPSERSCQVKRRFRQAVRSRSYLHFARACHHLASIVGEPTQRVGAIFTKRIPASARLSTMKAASVASLVSCKWVKGRNCRAKGWWDIAEVKYFPGCRKRPSKTCSHCYWTLRTNNAISSSWSRCILPVGTQKRKTFHTLEWETSPKYQL